MVFGALHRMDSKAHISVHACLFIRILSRFPAPPSCPTILRVTDQDRLASVAFLGLTSSPSHPPTKVLAFFQHPQDLVLPVTAA